LDKTSKQFDSLDKDIRASLVDVLHSNNQTPFKIELLQVKWFCKSKDSFQVYVRITSKNKTKETIAISILRNATKTGQLGKLIVLPGVFEVMSEKDYALLENEEGHLRNDKLDVVELVVTCVGAFIILAAVGWCLFYLCTTTHQRERCRERYNPCQSNRINT
jgi:hypothetical protein